MYEKQHTLKAPIALEGTGIHTGASSRVTIRPADENHGFAFQRMDLPGKPVVAALVENVVDVNRATTLAANGAKVHQVEHLLAALSGLQVDNALVEIDGPEPPALDGSARGYVEALERAGIEVQAADREFFVVDEPVRYRSENASGDIAAFPNDDFRMTVMVDYNSEMLGIQHATLFKLEDFKTEFAPARTFCFFHEVESLLEQGLIKGGSLENAIVIVDRPLSDAQLQKLRDHFQRDDIEVVSQGLLNNIDLHYPDEPARHKLLDLLGDLSLLGHPMKTQIVAARPGHRVNVEFVRKLKKQLNRKKLLKKYQDGGEGVFDINAIQGILPHRYPFLLVDRITHFDERTIEGYKNVTINEPFFQGHFPGNPVMPGVLIIEAMAQVGGIHTLQDIDHPSNYWVYFVAIEKARFRRPVVPGDTLHFKLARESFRRGICKMEGKAFVGEQLAAEATVTASLVRKPGV